ncbi:MAG: hypothetical protein Q8R82_17460, partial [Hyphomonadaceae bacterium]|nr:hypothetical protein [Hyphomonadaceae bacterium]
TETNSCWFPPRYAAMALVMGEGGRRACPYVKMLVFEIRINFLSVAIAQHSSLLPIVALAIHASFRAVPLPF